MNVGIFDSGVGGLSVWREIVKIMPGIPINYFSDSAYCPYGNKSAHEIIDRSLKISDFLISSGAAIIVVACNTATAAAIKKLRESFEIPFIGMEPAVKPAALHSQSRVIGVLATKGTLNGDHFHNAVAKYASDVKVIAKVGEGLVELIEAGETDGDRVQELLSHYINPMLEEGADNIVLGCTHYPFLTKAIKEITGSGVNIIDPATAVAKRVKNVMQDNHIFIPAASNPHNSTYFFTTSSLYILKKTAWMIDPKISEMNFRQVDI
jgi:glutamate racemase